jgi:hypothetical protein
MTELLEGEDLRDRLGDGGTNSDPQQAAGNRRSALFPTSPARTVHSAKKGAAVSGSFFATGGSR